MKGLSLVFACLLIFCAAGCVAAPEADVPALLSPASVTEDSAVVTTRDISVFTWLPARVRFEEYNILFGDTDLTVSSVEVMPGQKIKAGDVLIRLSTSGVRKEIDSLQARLDSQKKQYEYDRADRQTEIAIARILLDSFTVQSADTEDAQLQALHVQRLELADAQQTVRETDEIAYFQAKIDKLIQAKENAVLISDVDGTVISLPISVGESVRPYQVGAIVSAGDNIYVEYSGSSAFSPNYFASLHEITGRIDGIDYKLSYEPLTLEKIRAYQIIGVTAPARFNFQSSDVTGLSPGMLIELICVSGVSRGALAIPVNALYENVSGQYVYTLRNDPNGVAQKIVTPVKTGLVNESVAEITEGLQEGDVVCVKP